MAIPDHLIHFDDDPKIDAQLRLERAKRIEARAAEDRELERKWGAFPTTWMELIKAENEVKDRRKTMSPADFDSWRDWLEESRTRVEASHGGPYTPSA